MNKKYVQAGMNVILYTFQVELESQRGLWNAKIDVNLIRRGRKV